MKRFLFLIAACLFISFSAMAQGHTVSYYYLSYCESCNPGDDFAEHFNELTGVDIATCAFQAYNVATASGQAALEEAESKYNLTDARLPMAVVDGTVYQGANELNETLPSEALKWGGSTQSTVLYLYTPACESCAEAKAAVDALPENRDGQARECGIHIRCRHHTD